MRIKKIENRSHKFWVQHIQTSIGSNKRKKELGKSSFAITIYHIVSFDYALYANEVESTLRPKLLSDADECKSNREVQSQWKTIYTDCVRISTYNISVCLFFGQTGISLEEYIARN